ncbi:unnamed protein product [Peronospora belbahrii]|uniref:Uncharacterized protein n=1 Tax=Peronospora belbahrii TaxID=622444 RepID=A0AAU9KLK8_9STRA|nr:unnamed protein product [Peronospora belbahrii]CAH0521610.1 unnamed protein product [Peronospora belbahrii]
MDMDRRHLYPPQSLTRSYNGSNGPSSPPMQMQPPYFGNIDGGRVTARPLSYNHNHHSPVSSPAMAGESWAQNAPAGSGMATRGLKRHLPQQYDGLIYDGYEGGPGTRLPQQKAASSTSTPSTIMSRRGPSSLKGTIASASNNNSTTRLRTAQMQQMYGAPPSEDPMQYEPLGEARHPRDSTRYETWTSKQLRKKCSHLKLRGLKNVKKHVMVEALYRYYRNQRLKDMADAASADINNSKGGVSSRQQILSPQQQRRMEARRPSNISAESHSDMQYRSRFDQRSVGPSSQSQYGSSRSRSYANYGSQSPSPPSSGGDSGGSHPQRTGTSKPLDSGYYLDEEAKAESQYKEVPVTSEDVIRLVDVVLSPEFVDRLAAELSRWQFWVDVREMYIALLSRQHPPGSAGASGNAGTGGSATNSRNFKWSSMQLWEIWKELTFAYTKTCFEFTTAGVEDREYINFCDGRPDVYYLHQRLHARPDLLHLIKSNEYIDEKCTSDASESIAHEQQQAQQKQQTGPLIGSGCPMLRNHKRYKRSIPTGPASDAYNSARAIAAFRDGAAGTDETRAASGGNSGDNGSGQGSGDSRGHSPEENSTENSETTGEEGSSSNTANSNASNSSQDVSMRAALAEQKYFGLLLQNFEVIFESLHNKKVLLATLRKDSKAPDHLIADLHDDIHVLSALKKEFRNKLRRTMQ